MTGERPPVAVTGGAGFIGSHVTAALVAAGHPVLVVDDLSTGRTANLAAVPRTWNCSALDAIRARQLMGWTPGIALADGLAETVDWIRGSATATDSGVLAAR